MSETRERKGTAKLGKVLFANIPPSNMNYYLVDNPAGRDGRFNVGDDIQALAAEQFMPRVDRYLDKNLLYRFSGDSGKLILNGWFMHQPTQWPPTREIEPLLISFHMNPAAAEDMIALGKTFFRNNGPVGCRDNTTLYLMHKAGVPAYLSGCLTITLNRSSFSNNTTRNGVYFVDVLYKMQGIVSRFDRITNFVGRRSSQDRRHVRLQSQLAELLLTPDQRYRLQELKHSIPIEIDSTDARLAAARERLTCYANAELVVTSRIHCALPCLAFGTPVIFVDGALDADTEIARLRGITELMTVVRLRPDDTWDLNEIEANAKRTLESQRREQVEELRTKLIARCRHFLNET